MGLNWRCRLGFHRYGPWVWDKAEPESLGIYRLTTVAGSIPMPRQRRACKDCLKMQGPLVSSEERRYYESWRDR